MGGRVGRALTLRRAVQVLRSAMIPHAVIGGWAAFAHGGARLTRDLDLLATDLRVLDPKLWRPVEAAGIHVEIRHGDEDDPLDGVVRVGTARAVLPVDVVVPRGRWVAAVLERALAAGLELSLHGVPLVVVRPADLALLKLSYNPRDREDLAGLLARADAEQLMADVDAHIAELPALQREVWARLRARMAARR